MRDEQARPGQPRLKLEPCLCLRRRLPGPAGSRISLSGRACQPRALSSSRIPSRLPCGRDLTTRDNLSEPAPATTAPPTSSSASRLGLDSRAQTCAWPRLLRPHRRPSTHPRLLEGQLTLHESILPGSNSRVRPHLLAWLPPCLALFSPCFALISSELVFYTSHTSATTSSICLRGPTRSFMHERSSSSSSTRGPPTCLTLSSPTP